jgi:hypothetical protein
MSFFTSVRISSAWGRFFARHVMRLRHGIGMSAFFRLLIRDRATFARSIQRMIQWDFDRVIVGHADVIEIDAKQRVAFALREMLEFAAH